MKLDDDKGGSISGDGGMPNPEDVPSNLCHFLLNRLNYSLPGTKMLIMLPGWQEIVPRIVSLH